MGAPKTTTAGGGANTGTSQNWNNFLGGQLQGGGFNNMMNQAMAGQGYQNYNSFFNNQGGGLQGGAPTVGNPFQAPNYNQQGATAAYNPGQQANTNFSNAGLNNYITGVRSNAQQVDLSGLGGLANMFMGAGQRPQQQNTMLGPQRPVGVNELLPGFKWEPLSESVKGLGIDLGDKMNQMTMVPDGSPQIGQNLGGSPQGLAQTPTVGWDQNLLNYLSQGLGGGSNFQFSTPTIGSPNMDVNSQYAKDMSGMLERQHQRSSLDLMSRLSAGGGGLFGTPQGQMQGLLDAEALPAIAQARAQANLQQGTFDQTANLANQNASLATQKNQADFNLGNRNTDISQLGLVANSQLGNRGLDVSQRNVDANNTTSNQQAGLAAALQAAGLQLNQAQGLNQLGLGTASLLNQANDSQNQNYLNAIGMNNQLANNGNQFNLANAGMQNQWNMGMNNLNFNTANANAGFQQQGDMFNGNAALQNQQQQNQFQLGQGGIGAQLAGQQSQMIQSILSNLFNSFQQSNQIGSPQAQVFQQPSQMGQIMGMAGGLGSLFGNLFGQNGAFPNVFGGGQSNPFGGGMTNQPTGPFGSGWQNPINANPTFRMPLYNTGAF